MTGGDILDIEQRIAREVGRLRKQLVQELRNVRTSDWDPDSGSYQISLDVVLDTIATKLERNEDPAP
jgi:hypothetical protein